jgi:hypothetical protein
MFAHGHYNVPAFVNYASTQNAGTDTTVVVAKPTNTAAGDLMVSVCGVANGTSTWTGDAGWTEVIDQNSPPDLRVAYLRAGASEGSSYTFTSSDSTHTKSGAIFTYRNAGYDTIGAIATGSPTCVAPSITVAQDGSILLALFTSIGAGGTFTAPTGMTLLASDTDGTSPSWAVYYQEVLAGATGTRTSTVSSLTAGVLISLSPA